MASEPTTHSLPTMAEDRDRLEFTEGGVILHRGGSSPDASETRTPESDRRRNQTAIRLLNFWTEQGDEQEQRATLAFLKEALDLKGSS